MWGRETNYDTTKIMLGETILVWFKVIAVEVVRGY